MSTIVGGIVLGAVYAVALFVTSTVIGLAAPSSVVTACVLAGSAYAFGWIGGRRYQP